MPLVACRRLHGYAKMSDRRPALTTHRDVLLDNGSLYDWKQRLIPDAALFSGVSFPGRPTMEPFEPRTTTAWPPRIREQLRDVNLVWGGQLRRHYGHFLLETLPRLWPAILPSYRHSRFVFHDSEPGPRPSFIDELLELLGIAENAVFLSGRVCIDEISVPECSFEINNYGMPAFRDLCLAIGGRLPDPPERTDEVVYVSKAALTMGTARFINEDVFARYLEQAGIRVLYPERHSVRNQLSFWQGSRYVTGYLGSAMHTSIFAPPGTSCLIMNHESQVYSNQPIIEKLCGRETGFFYPEHDMTGHGPDLQFQLNFRLSDPRKTADEFLHLIDNLVSGRPASRRTIALPPKSVHDTLYFDEPLGTNVSIGKNATQSSIFYPHSNGDTPQDDARNAVNGIMPARYAFHTARDDRAWWMVDLGAPHELFEIRIFNRQDIGVEHARAFTIAVSEDATRWTDIAAKQAGMGDTDTVFRYQTDQQTRGRFVRLTLDNPGYLHLKQIEVFGLPLSDDMAGGRLRPNFAPATPPVAAEQAPSRPAR